VFETKTRRLLSETNLWATALAFTPDGNLLAAGFRDGRITVYGLPGLTEVAAFQIEDNAITSLAFQRDLVRRTNAVPNSTWRLAAGDRGSFIFVWELAKGGTIARLRGSNFDAQALAFNPDGTLLSLPCPETKAAEDCRSP
jgi:WD40 repeat protein